MESKQVDSRNPQSKIIMPHTIINNHVWAVTGFHILPKLVIFIWVNDNKRKHNHGYLTCVLSFESMDLKVILIGTCLLTQMNITNFDRM